MALGAGVAGGASAAPSAIEIDPATPVDHWLAPVAATLLPSEPAHGLTDIATGQIGWFEFAFRIETTGWRQLTLQGAPNLYRVELDVDAAPPPADRPAVSGSLRPGDWIWLEAGAHRLRVIKNEWSGLPRINAIRLVAPADGLSTVFRILDPGVAFAATLGHCAPLRLMAGGDGRGATLDVSFARDGNEVGRRTVAVPASKRPVVLAVDQPCDEVGDVVVSIRTTDDRATAIVLARTAYSVFDPRPVEPNFRRGRLLTEIDAVDRAPDYVSGTTSIGRSTAGLYRESSERGTTTFLRSRDKSVPPSWFAYSITGMTAGRTNLFEVTYPDDAPRVFVAGIRAAGGRGYTRSIGAETDVLWPVSGESRRMEALFWPSSADGRAIVFNIHDGMKAAVSKIRVYDVDTGETPAAARPPHRRDVVAWYEEGSNFRLLVGYADEPGAVYGPVDRYLRLMRYKGATVVAPTMAIYGWELFPSTSNLALNDQRTDLTAALLRGAEHYGLSVLPELHPRADEVLWSARDRAAIDRRLLVSGIGEPNLQNADGTFRRPAFYNALDPDVRRWYRDMIGELALRYRDYPAFAGVQLRLSQWVNSGLDNLVSLDWGYDAVTVRRFLQMRSIRAPEGMDLDSDTPDAVASRHDFLLRTQRSAWIEWRCEQMRDVFADIVATVRAARPDLVVRLHLSSLSEGKQPLAAGLRELGIDPVLLGAIDGLELLDGRFPYGARERSEVWRRTARTQYLQPGVLDELAPPGGRPSVAMSMQYIEIPGKLWPTTDLGWPAPANDPWVSSAVEPPGRLALARLAESVALFDVYTLGDGGNGYVFGGEGSTTFLHEFATLPRIPFERVSGIPDPLVVRTAPGYFYVVNLSDEPLSATLHLEKPDRVERITTGETPATGATLPMRLDAYELRVFRCGDCGSVAGADVLTRPGK